MEPSKSPKHSPRGTSNQKMDLEYDTTDYSGEQSHPGTPETGDNSNEHLDSPSLSKNLDIPSPGLSDTLSDGWAQYCKSVKKSRTHDCVMGMGMRDGLSLGRRDSDRTPTAVSHCRLVSSASFSEFGVSKLLQENRSASGCSRDIIDYRNLTPQVPFVPSIAKSIPKKRISLRKPRKAIKDLFGIKKHKHEKAVSPRTPCRGPDEKTSVPKRTKKPLRHRDRMSPRHRTPREFNEHLSDTSSDCCASVCEDAASLKSFGSQAGCGEIFADEEHLTSLESTYKNDPIKDAYDPWKKSPTMATFQGGKEQLASPTYSEVIDIFGMWESLSKIILSDTNSRTETDATVHTSPVDTTPSANSASIPSENLSSSSAELVESQLMELKSDRVTPKSENQESTSDEGYCDYVSPGLEDSKRSLTPIHSSKFPRDTYSGDALYELFYDPSEAEVTPIFDDEMDLTQSIIGQSTDHPLSMYSFHVGAEENLAPPLAMDFISQELLQSNWVGKDCLLKLCDTEISLAMGIVNWLKQKTVKESTFRQVDSEDVEDARLKGRDQKTYVKKVPSVEAAVTMNSKEDEFYSRHVHSSQQDGILPSETNNIESHVITPSYNNQIVSQPRTPTSGLCFRIFNIDSPSTPCKNLQSPMLQSPASGTSSVFVLAINRQSLCETCRNSLKQGAKELYLCSSCISLIEHIKTSEVWRCASQQCSQSVTGGLLPSPVSTCRLGSDISIASLVEQCASQMCSFYINSGQNQANNEREAVFTECNKDTITEKNKDHSHGYLKSKQKTKGRMSGKSGSGRYKCADGVPGSSAQEEKGLGLVTSNGSDALVLETFQSPRSQKNLCPVSDTDSSQTNRPTFLPLPSCTLSKGTCKKDDTARGKPRERLRQHKKSTANRHGPSGSDFPEHRKVE